MSAERGGRGDRLPRMVERRDAQPDWEETALLEGMDIEIIPDTEEAPLVDDSPVRQSPRVIEEGEAAVVIIEDEDGVLVDFDPQDEVEVLDANNLAEVLDDDVLASIASDLIDQFKENNESRKDWLEAFDKGIDLLGFKYEDRNQPFEGASGVTHPILAEAAYQFQAQAYNEMIPANGPVRTVVVGERTRSKEDQALRVREYMNYYLTDRMEEYDSETDQMLFYLPLQGSTFKKMWFDQTLDRVVCRFIPAKDLVVPFGASDLESAGNVTQRIRMPLNEVRKLQVAGFYRDVPVLETANENDSSSLALEEATGEVAPSAGQSNEVVLYECHVDYDIPGFEDTDEEGEPTGIKLPYIITVAAETMQVLSIRANYDPEDELRRKINYFVHYRFLPGLGFYGVGLIHAIGGLSRTATAALRQLIDAGTLSNLPAGFKLRNLRVASSDEPIQPGEWRDVDAPDGTLQGALYPLPYKEPSQTLFLLLGFVVEAAQRFAAITDMKVGDNDQQLAHGTVIALLEQGTRVMSAIHKRMHSAMRKEFKIMRRLIRDYLSEDGYPYEVEGASREIKREDFNDSVGVLPVSDPNIFSSTQRIVIAQSQMEAAAAAPELYNMHEVHRRYLEALGAKDIDSVMRARPHDSDDPIDPAQENINALDQLDLKAFMGQDHEAHIMAHMVFGMSPLVAQAPAVAMALQKHIMEHAQLQAEEEAEIVIQQMGREVSEVDQARVVAHLVAQNMVRMRELNGQLSGEGEEGPDPVVLLKEQELQQRAAKDAADQDIRRQQVAIDAADKEERIRVARERIQSQEEIVAARIAAARERDAMRSMQQ